MTLCVNQSGTWREITTQCVNVSGTWRNIATGCINQSGTWRCYGFYNFANCPLGSNVEGGYLIYKSSGTGWIVAPSSAEVSRTWYSRNDAVTRAQAVTGCTGWFVPTCAQLQNPGYAYRAYWDSYASENYWSNSEHTFARGYYVDFGSGNGFYNYKDRSHCVRAFRYVSY